MLRLERDTYIDFEHALAQGLRLVALQRRAYSVDGAFPYSGYTVSSRGVQKGLTSAAGVDSSATGHTFLVVANLAAVSSDAVAFGRLRYTGGANYGAGLRFNAATLELDGGIGTSAWHYSASSSAVQTGRHVYAGAIGVGDGTSTGRLWRDGALLTTGVHSATAYAASRWDGQVDLGGGTATGASAITGAISGHIESGLYYARSLPTEDVEYLSAAMLRGRLPFMRSQRIWVPVSAGGSGPQTVAISQASESDTAQTFSATVGSVTAIGQASESNAAQALATRQTKAIGQAVEADAAQALAAAQRKALGQAAETDTAQAFATVQRKAVGQAIETDSAQPIAYSAPGTIGQVLEADAAQPIVAKQARAIGQASETEFAQPITAGTGIAVAIGMALEIDTAGAFVAPLLVAIGQALEVDAARAMTSIGGDVSIDPATIRRVARSPALTRLARSPAMVRSTNGL